MGVIVTFISLKGNRESLTRKSEEYKKKVIEYMKSRGYMLTHDSYFDGTLPDLIFKRIFIEGDKETWVETKNTELSLKDGKFLSELGRVFNAYIHRNEPQRFNYFIFVKKCLSQRIWKNIFEETKVYPDDVKNLMKSIEENLKGKDLENFKQHSFDELNYFVNDITLLEGDYANLSEDIDANIESEHFSVDSSLLRDISKVSTKTEKLLSNIMKVTSLPKVIWIAECKDKIGSDFWKNNRDAIAYFHKNKIYSVRPISSKSTIHQYINSETVHKINIDKWVEDEKIKNTILKYLIKSFIIYKGRKIGLTYYQEQECLFFQDHRPYMSPVHKYKNRVVSRTYTGFIKHDALKLDVKQITKDFFVIFDLILLFTKNGRLVITGDESTKLHRKFRKSFTFNDSEMNKLLFWIKAFGFTTMTLNGEQEYFTLSPPIQIESPVSYEGGEEFDTTLLDFMKDEEGEKCLLELIT